MLAFEPEVEVAAVSSIRETDPVGLIDQPPFLNAAAAVETELGPRALLDLLLAVERALGRTRDGPRFGPRTIDLDLLLYGDGRDRRAGARGAASATARAAFRARAARRARPRSASCRAAAAVQALLAGLQSA